MKYKVEAEWIVDDQATAHHLAESLMHMGAETAGSSPIQDRPEGFHRGCPREGCACHVAGPVCEECMCVDGGRFCPRCGWGHDKHGVCVHRTDGTP